MGILDIYLDVTKKMTDLTKIPALEVKKAGTTHNDGELNLAANAKYVKEVTEVVGSEVAEMITLISLEAK